MDSWNDPQSEPYKIFPGPNNQQMPKLIAEGRNPISPSLVFWRRLEVINKLNEALKKGDKASAEAWKAVYESCWDNYADTGFGIARHPEGNAVLVPDAQYLRQLNLKTKLLNGYAIMPDGMFESLDGHRFTAEKIKQYGGRELSQKQALADPFLEAFIQDKTLRDASIVNTFAQGKERFKYNEMMGVYFPDAQKQPVMGLVCVRRLDDRSIAWGVSLNYGGRLIGVSPGVAEGDARKLEYIVQAK